MMTPAATARRDLSVLLYGRRVGTLHRPGPGKLRFTYEPQSGVPIAAPILSASLPYREATFSNGESRPFFEGLLPEDIQRRRVADELRLRFEASFEMLERLGRDCAGAVMVVPAGEEAEALAPLSGSVDWLDDDGLAAHIGRLPVRPLGIDPGGRVRLSLAGVQGKLVVVVGDDGRIGLPIDGHMSTHLLKPAGELDGLVNVEALCMRALVATGVPAAICTVVHVGGRTCLLIDRYDRRRASDGTVTRIHQEDGCQALGLLPGDKYFDPVTERGPTVSAIAHVLEAHAGVPARDRAALFDQVVARFVLGDSDGHGKNTSILIDRDGVMSLAPMYDVVCTQAWDDEFGQQLGMPIGSTVDPDAVTMDDFRDLAASCGLATASVPTRVGALAGRLVTQVDRERERMRSTDVDHVLLDRVVAIARRRAAQLGM